MANKPITMTQIRRIIQLKAEGASNSHISRTLQIHRSTLNTYFFRLASSGKSVSALLAIGDEELGKLVYCENNTQKPVGRFQELKKHFAHLQSELSRTGVTRLLLWQEYRIAHPDGYGYTQFCEHLGRHRKILKATMHLHHDPGMYLQIDFAGKSLSYGDRFTGELIRCPVLVCTQPYSGYTYVEALVSARQEHLFCALNRCLEFFGGVPRNILSDNMKQYVVKNDRYEFTFSEIVDQWSVHYHTNLEATRPRKPKDKPSVENSVYHSYLRIYARLRNEEFESLAALNRRIQVLLQEHNQHTFQKLPSNRREQFHEEEQPLLQPLPAEAFLIRRKTRAKVQMNYHVVLGEDRHQYSVPHQYIGQQTSIIYTEHTIEIYLSLTRIATHTRCYRKHGYTTLREHMPQNHRAWQEHLGWDADYFVAVGEKISENAIEVFNRVLASKDMVEQSYR